MNSEDLRHPRINILYIPLRKLDAEILYSRYVNLGAKVTLHEVGDDHSTRQHIGKLYFFDNNLRFKEIADSLAKNLISIESVSPQHMKLEQGEKINYAIWIVSKDRRLIKPIDIKAIKPILGEKVKLEAKVAEKPTQPLTIMTKTSLIQCPNCHSSVRSNRLAKHLEKVHRKKSQPIFTAKTTRRKIKQSKSKSPKRQSIKLINWRLQRFDGKAEQLNNHDSLASITSRLLDQIEKNKQKHSDSKTSGSHRKTVINSVSFNKQSYFSPNSQIKGSNAKKCRHCRKPAILGEDVCYNCQIK